ncbi:MAG: alpha/beta hydrolase [Lachnospiraceae bacterium]|nr:alpha/beta hydrolase [Lachnospiraceae bacterium]
MKRTEFSFPSATGTGDISAYKYLPDGSYDTVLIIHHGMAENITRYEGFIGFLNKNGIAVYTHDMAGHGRSCKDTSLSGWFGEKDGYLRLADDFHTMVTQAACDNPGCRIIVFGHSMGSFICRIYLNLYPDDKISGAIFMGTGGPNPAAGMGKLMASLIALFKGRKYKSRLMHGIIFANYGKGFEGRTDFDWLTRDNEIVDKYIADPECGFLFTVQGVYDLIEANVASNADEWYKNLNKDLPLFIISGAEDPVGDHSLGVKTVSDRLKAAGHNKTTLKLYPSCRHELLNELNKDEVMTDILDWISSL